jgi:hypothetical protein
MQGRINKNPLFAYVEAVENVVIGMNPPELPHAMPKPRTHAERLNAARAEQSAGQERG